VIDAKLTKKMKQFITYSVLILKSLDNSFILFIFAFITDLLFYFKNQLFRDY